MCYWNKVVNFVCSCLWVFLSAIYVLCDPPLEFPPFALGIDIKLFSHELSNITNLIKVPVALVLILACELLLSI